MEIINMLDNPTNHLSKYRTQKWIEINADAHGACNSNN